LSRFEVITANNLTVTYELRFISHYISIKLSLEIDYKQFRGKFKLL